MGGQGKGGARAAFLPPAKTRRPTEGEGGPTITEKIAARKASGGAEAWDDFKARVKSQQQEQHAIENHDVLMSAQHREMLDRERDARLARALPVEKSEKKRKASDDSDSSSDDSDSRRRKKHKHHKHHHSHHKEKKKHKHKSHKEKHRDHKGKKRRREDDDSSDEKPSKASSGPVKLSDFLAEQSDGSSD